MESHDLRNKLDDLKFKKVKHPTKSISWLSQVFWERSHYCDKNKKQANYN